jgi:hypothetical protein
MPDRDVHLVPLLAAGGHWHPRQGGCLLEVVSCLPGGAWTDHSPRIDPVLGVLVRAVNDASSDDQRPALAQLAPWLATLPPVPTQMLQQPSRTSAPRRLFLGQMPLPPPR